MHTFTGALAVAACLALTSNAATYQERFNVAAGKDFVLIKTTAKVNPLTWTLNVKTILNEDTGYQYMRWQHTLVAPIQKTDEIIFEVNFQSKSDPAIQIKGKMGEDNARCTVAINANDNRFWKGTLADGYYNCDAVAATGKDICQNENTWGADTVYIETAEFNSWTIPTTLTDTDVDVAANRWCDALNIKGKVKNQYWCKSIKCHMERKLQTGDVLQDFYFNPTSKTVCDTLTIRPGRARIFFNQQVYPKAFGSKRTGKEGPLIEIPICAGATTIASVAAGLALVTAYLF